jgi:hypothetical protein
MGAETMGMDVGKEHHWQDVALHQLEPLRVTDIFSTILVPGYKFMQFSWNTITAVDRKMEIFH